LSNNRKSKIRNPKTENPLIVLTNDDGIQSPGLHALARAMLKLGDILIVAPREQQTSMGRAFAGTGRVRQVNYRVDGKRVRAYAVSASPAIAVRNAVLLYADRTPALLVSGINYGENVANGITISGTVCAAIEGAALGVPALAVSQATPPSYHRTYSDSVNFACAAHFAQLFARRILERGMPRGADVVNLNVPEGASRKTPWRWTRASRNSYFRSQVREGKRGKFLRGYEVDIVDHVPEQDSDVCAVIVDRVVSLTPLTFDLTANISAAELARWGKG
jgi:5'/3'-nucleotidase